MSDYVNIGSLKKPFGVKGELKVDIEPAFWEDFLRARVLFVTLNGKPLPYFVERIEAGNVALLKLEEVDSKEAASRMSNRPLMLRSQDILPAEERTLVLEEEGLEYQRCVGFLLTDVQTGPVGTIVEILEYPQQEMAVVRQEAREWLIPLHAGLIHELDEAERVLRMDLPEGLLVL